jgi:hypothetical protein
MKHNKTGRVLAAIFLGILFGVYKHFLQMRWLGQGRAAYLADQDLYFDKIVRMHSLPFMMVAGILLAVVAVGLYETIARAINNALPPSTVEE